MERADLGRDLQLGFGRSYGGLSLQVTGGDLALTEGIDNLAQAVWLRLVIPLGDFAHLGHPEYGSRLHMLIGRLVNASTIALAKAYVREALRREPRLETVTHLDVRPDPLQPDTLLIELTVKPVGEAPPISLAMNFALEPGQVEANTHGTTGG